MIFLIEYDREKGSLVSLTEYKDSDLRVAERQRLDLELELRKTGSVHEVVLLQAESKEALKRTHLRYFEDLRGIVKSTLGSGAGRI